MIKYGYNIWLDDKGDVQMGNDAIEEISAFMFGLGIFFDEDPSELAPETYYERIFIYYKSLPNIKTKTKKSFERWVEAYTPEGMSLNELTAIDWLDVIANLYMDLCGVEFPESAESAVRERMN